MYEDLPHIHGKVIKEQHVRRYFAEQPLSCRNELMQLVTCLYTNRKGKAQQCRPLWREAMKCQAQVCLPPSRCACTVLPWRSDPV